MISPKEAQDKVLERAKTTKTEVFLLESLNLVLSENITSEDDIPAYDNSAMDGYALIAKDTKGANASPVSLKLLDVDIPAGKIPLTNLEHGSCMAIMTGAPIPNNCDAVIRKEDTKKIGTEILACKQCEAGENIRRKGEDIKKGEVALQKDKKIFAADIGVLASLGKMNIPVYRPPVVGIISTGDEIIPIDKKLSIGRVRDSNSYSLSAQLKELGIEYIPFGIVKDNQKAMCQKIMEGLSKCDILLLSGGVSVGDYDFVKETLIGLGAELIFWKVNQKPGKPLVFLTYGDQYIFGLPGNPVSVMVCFEMYVRPLIKKIIGDRDLFRPRVIAKAAHEFINKKGRVHFARVRLVKKEGRYFFCSTGMQGSGILTSLSRADGIAVFGEQAGNIQKGMKAEIFILKDS